MADGRVSFTLVFIVAALLVSGDVAGSQDTDEGGKQTAVGTAAEPSTETARKPAPDMLTLYRENGGERRQQDVAVAVENELHHDAHHDALISLDDVDVAADGGVVRLSGTVPSLVAKERAARVARTAKGVTNVVNELVVRRLTTRSAKEIESAVVDALLVSPATEAFQLQVQADPDGSVRLSGTVESWAERELADHVAKSVAGVTSVRNDVKVEHETIRPDTEIAAEIRRMLQWDAYLDGSRIDVSVRDGTVKLSGAVETAAEKMRALGIAWTAGTRDVDASGLTVAKAVGDVAKRRGVMTDAAIANAVQSRFRADPYVDPEELEALVDDGSVILRGSVDSLKAKRVADAIAQGTRGVTNVRNRLRVRPDGSALTDQEMQTRIVAALAANPITEAYEITVTVDRGAVTLAGRVENWFEKGMVDDVAAGISGVREVNNRIAVDEGVDRLVYDPHVDSWSIYEFDWYQPEPVTIWRRDGSIAAEIEDELRWSPFVDADEVQVSVHNGVATLTGTVDNIAESSAAQENAFEGGASGVINQLEIES
jgi:osmotically-inducible protein OsmY